MSGKKYYKILNLPEGASKSQIKKSYRALVKIYHPDVNDDPKAQKKFIEITEAYEALLDPTTKKEAKPKSRNKARTEKWKKYKEESKRRYEERELKKKQEIQEFYRSLRSGWRRNWIKINVALGLLISILMTLDQFAIPTKETIHIIHLKNYSEHNSITTNLGEFTLQEGHVSIRKKPMLTLFSTPYLKHALYVTYQDEGTLRKEKISYSPNGPSFYWGYSIVLSVSLLPLVFFLFFRRNNGWFVFGHYAILIVTTPWLIYFLVQHPSIIHIVTFDLL